MVFSWSAQRQSLKHWMIPKAEPLFRSISLYYLWRFPTYRRSITLKLTRIPEHCNVWKPLESNFKKCLQEFEKAFEMTGKVILHGHMCWFVFHELAVRPIPECFSCVPCFALCHRKLHLWAPLLTYLRLKSLGGTGGKQESARRGEARVFLPSVSAWAVSCSSFVSCCQPHPAVLLGSSTPMVPTPPI